MAPTHDTRLLSNLIKAEKDAQASFKAWTKDSSSANAALNAWSLADSGDSKELMDVTAHLSQLLNTITASQRTYLSSLTFYVQSLTTLHTHQTSLHTVLRDREILITRLIKLSNKKPSISTEGALIAHEKKLEEAQNELEACEAFLRDEERKLDSLKRRTFGGEMTERMGKLGELGTQMSSVAEEAEKVLERFTVRRREDGEEDDDQHQRGDYPVFLHSLSPSQALSDDGADSITPSHSASQALSIASSSSSIYSLEPPPAIPALSNGRPSSPLATAPPILGRTISPAPLARAISPPPFQQLQIQQPQQHQIVRKQPSAQQISIPISASLNKPIFLPTAPKSIIQQQKEQQQTNGLPTFSIPKAPTNVFTAPPLDDSSDEEDARAFDAMANTGTMARRNVGGGSSVGGGGGKLRRRAMSDASSLTGGAGKRRNSFFGGIAALFRRKEKSYDEDEDDADDYRRKRSPLATSKWETRTDRNLSVVSRTSFGATGARRRDDDDSSEEESRPRNLVKIVNDPKARIRALSVSDVGKRPASILNNSGGAGPIGRPPLDKRHSVASAAAPSTTTTIKRKKVKKASSDIGPPTNSSLILSSYSPPGTATTTILPRPPPLAAPIPLKPIIKNSSVSIAETTPTIKKKKKTTHGTTVNPSETVVIIATPDMLPPSTSAALNATSLSRSNTVASANTTGTATIKKRKKRSTLPPPSAFSGNPPTAEDLANSLPSAKPSMYASLPTGPLPTDSVGKKDDEVDDVAHGILAGKAPKSGKETVKRTKKELAKHGNETWVSHENGTATGGRKVGGPSHGAEESLLSVVERGGAETETVNGTSRKYGTVSDEANSTVIPRKVESIPTGAPTTNGGVGLSKRKSVRLADGPSPAQSPPSSVRSETLSASASYLPPKHGILVNTINNLQPPPVPPLPSTSSGIGEAPISGWDTRLNGRNGNDDTSEDEDEEYSRAKKAFAKNTRGLQKAFSVDLKGKGREKS